jgi:hypothetical protein
VARSFSKAEKAFGSRNRRISFSSNGALQPEASMQRSLELKFSIKKMIVLAKKAYFPFPISDSAFFRAQVKQNG